MVSNGKIVYRGAKEICNVIGENYKNMLNLVKNENLPAWRRSESGSWMALPEDLKRWVSEQREKYLK